MSANNKIRFPAIFCTTCIPENKEVSLAKMYILVLGTILVNQALPYFDQWVCKLPFDWQLGNQFVWHTLILKQTSESADANETNAT